MLHSNPRELLEGLDHQAELEALVQSVIITSESEGESLKVGTAPCSVARQRGRSFEFLSHRYHFMAVGQF